MELLWIVMLAILAPGIKTQPNHRRECCDLGRAVAESHFTNQGITEQDFRWCSVENMKKQLSIQVKQTGSPPICAMMARSCCLKLYKSEICRRAASEEVDCESIMEDKAVILSQIKLECCICCQENSSIPMDTFDNCRLLNGKCPRKTAEMVPTTLETVTSIDNATAAILYEASTIESTEIESINATGGYGEANTTEGDSTMGPIEGTELLTTVDFTDPYLNSTKSELKSSTLRSDSSINASTNPFQSPRLFPTTTTERPVVCDYGFHWDPVRHVCVQMMVSCPKNFVIHPDSNRCVPIIEPQIPCFKGYSYNQFKNKCLDIDECQSSKMCQNNTQICVNKVGSFSCDCIKGFKVNKMGQCEDIDECLPANVCSEDKKCKNLIGSYRCVRAIPCGFGWKEDSETNECIDVDECETFRDICGHGMKCVNIRGSHVCEDEECPNNMKRNNRGKCSRCRDGYKMNSDTNSCEDIDECFEKAHLYKGRCKGSEKCINLPGSYECLPKKKCRPGTLLTKNGTECEDIDECKEMSFRCDSDHICINTFSSYQCVASSCAPSQNYDYPTLSCLCKEGYRSNHENICEDIDECNDLGPNGLCGSMFTCVNKPGEYKCINKVECSKGMYRPSSDSSCQDVDECETGEGKCATNTHCVNMVGSYKCMCDRGFIKVKNGTCADINECLLFRPEESCPDLEARCVNTPGSYKCQCPKGFQWSDYPLKKCLDVDECRTGENPCGVQHVCQNIIGTYKCLCSAGYRLTIEGDKCEDIDECQLLPKKCANGICMNIPGSYECQCPKGFLADNKEICRDIDECSTYQKTCPVTPKFQSPRRCINLLGYFKCVNSSCPDKYSRTESGDGYMCSLNKADHCSLQSVGCLFSWPYRKTFVFIEVSAKTEYPRTLTRVNRAHLPPGNHRISLRTKYALNTDTKEVISTNNALQISRSRTQDQFVEVVLKFPIAAPAEVLLYLHMNAYHGDRYLGHSEAFISLYFTKYPDSAPHGSEI